MRLRAICMGAALAVLAIAPPQTLFVRPAQAQPGRRHRSKYAA